MKYFSISRITDRDIFHFKHQTTTMPKGRRTRKRDVPGSEEYDSEEIEEVFIDIDSPIYKAEMEKKQKRRRQQLFPQQRERTVRRQMFSQNTKATLLLVGYIIAIALTIYLNFKFPMDGSGGTGGN